MRYIVPANLTNQTVWDKQSVIKPWGSPLRLNIRVVGGRDQIAGQCP